MKFFIPYWELCRGQKTNKKEQIYNFIQHLLKLGFPQENLEKQESGIEIETDSTVLQVEDVPHGTLDATKLCYGNINLIQKVEKHDLWDRSCSITIYDITDTDLPQTLRLSKEEIQEEQTMANEIALKEKSNVHKECSEYNGEIWYNSRDVKTHLNPLIREALIQVGYSGNALESKLYRVLNYAYQKFNKFADQENAQIAQDKERFKREQAEQKKLENLPLFSHAYALLTKDHQHEVNPRIQTLINILNRLNNGAASLNPYRMGSSKKRDNIAHAVIETMKSEGVEGIERALVDKRALLYQAINQKRITRLTLFGKTNYVSFTECHSAQEIGNLEQFKKDI